MPRLSICWRLTAHSSTRSRRHCWRPRIYRGSRSSEPWRQRTAASWPRGSGPNRWLQGRLRRCTVLCRRPRPRGWQQRSLRIGRGFATWSQSGFALPLAGSRCVARRRRLPPHGARTGHTPDPRHDHRSRRRRRQLLVRPAHLSQQACTVLLEGSPRTLLENGVPHRQALRKEAITETELRSIAHERGFRRLEDVSRIALRDRRTSLRRGQPTRSPAPRVTPESAELSAALLRWRGHYEDRYAAVLQYVPVGGHPERVGQVVSGLPGHDDEIGVFLPRGV